MRLRFAGGVERPGAPRLLGPAPGAPGGGDLLRGDDRLGSIERRLPGVGHRRARSGEPETYPGVDGHAASCSSTWRGTSWRWWRRRAVAGVHAPGRHRGGQDRRRGRAVITRRVRRPIEAEQERAVRGRGGDRVVTPRRLDGDGAVVAELAERVERGRGSPPDPVPNGTLAPRSSLSLAWTCHDLARQLRDLGCPDRGRRRWHSRRRKQTPTSVTPPRRGTGGCARPAAWSPAPPAALLAEARPRACGSCVAGGSTAAR